MCSPFSGSVVIGGQEVGNHALQTSACHRRINFRNLVRCGPSARRRMPQTREPHLRMNLERARTQMLEQQVRAWDVLDPRVLEAMAQVPREEFVRARYRGVAFADTAIPLGHAQVMMSPKVEGRALQALALGKTDRVLEVGTGSGFFAACI